jgi:hypothetical protein
LLALHDEIKEKTESRMCLRPGKLGRSGAAPVHGRACWGMVRELRSTTQDLGLGQGHSEALTGVVAPGAGGIEADVVLPVLAGFERGAELVADER